TNVYATFATFPVTVTIRDAGGQTATASGTAQMDDPPPNPTITSFSVSPNPGTEGANVTASGSFVDPGIAGDHTVTITWGTGGDSTTLTLPEGTTDFSTTHAFPEEGNQLVGVTVTNSVDGSDSTSTTETVNDAALSVSDVAIAPTEGAAFSST